MTTSSPSTLSPEDAQQRAWRVLLGSFGTFMLLLAAFVVLLQWFLFRSTVPLDVTVTAAQGTIRVEAPNSTEPIAITSFRAGISSDSQVETDASSQAVFSFKAGAQENAIGQITLHRDSSAIIEQARRPRFEFNTHPNLVRLRLASGQVTVFIPQSERLYTIDIVTNQGTIRLAEPGSYNVTMSSSGIDLTVAEGEALLMLIEGEQAIYAGEAAHVANGIITIERAAESMVENNDFEQDFEETWVFYNDTEPGGIAITDFIDGRAALILDRSQTRWPGIALGHGETGIVQDLNLNVAEFDTLAMQIVFEIEEQSLSTCGELGSECPLMVRLNYTDVQGREQTYIVGFYATHNPANGYPLACDTCRTDHIRIATDSWYTYESGNLMDRLPADQKPAELHSFQVYASGHAYRVAIAQADLRGG